MKTAVKLLFIDLLPLVGTTFDLCADVGGTNPFITPLAPAATGSVANIATNLVSALASPLGEVVKAGGSLVAGTNYFVVVYYDTNLGRAASTGQYVSDGSINHLQIAAAKVGTSTINASYDMPFTSLDLMGAAIAAASVALPL